MNIREWRKLALQCTLLLGITLAVGLYCNLPALDKLGNTVYAQNEEPGEGDALSEQDVERMGVVYSRKSYIESLSDVYIRITKARACTASAVYLENRYMESCVCLGIEGVPADAYSAQDVERVNRGKVFRGKVHSRAKKELARKLSVDIEKGKELRIRLKLKRLYEPQLYETDRAYYITLHRPRDMYDKIIVLDAGHGGIDEGTLSRDWKYREKECTLRIVKYLKELLDETDIKVYYTRLGDWQVSKKQRTWLANQTEADLFVSVHCNASDYGDTTAYGMEGLYSGRKRTSSRYLTSRKLASILTDEIAGYTDRRNRGIIQRNGLYLMHHSQVPVSIIEIGYMSNSDDLKYMIKDKNQKEIARGLFRGMKKALDYIDTKKGKEEHE